MTPEEHKMLEETRALVEENARILHSMQRSSRIGTAFKTIYWILIIGLSFGAYYLIQPYVNTLKGTLNEMQSTGSNTESPFSISGALKNLQDATSLYKN